MARFSFLSPSHNVIGMFAFHTSNACSNPCKVSYRMHLQENLHNESLEISNDIFSAEEANPSQCQAEAGRQPC